MARRCFEVGKFLFTFCCTDNKNEKTNLIFEDMKKYLKSYASNTEFEFSIKNSDDCDKEVNIILSKNISINTANTILARMLGEQIVYMGYTPSKKAVNIVVLR